MKKDILVSVVVPVYNVEKYIAKCLNSLCGQTYNNIEIIVVDDGSYDDSTRIIKQYANMDMRIKYIKRENGGLGAARNTGLKESSGEYICFVDSDDWVRNDYIEKFVSAAIIDDSDVVISNIKYVFPDGTERPRTPRINTHEVITNKDALGREFTGYQYRFHAPNKFCKKSIFINNDIWFPEGKLYEDVFTTYKILLNASKISLIAEDTYYYLQSRFGSIMNTKITPQRFTDMFEALGQIISDDIIIGMGLKDEIQVLYATNIISLVNYIYPIYEKCPQEYMDKYKSYIFNDKFFNILDNVARNKKIGIIPKIRILFIKYKFEIYCKLMQKIKKN